MATENIVLKVTADTSDVTKSIDKVGESVDGTSGAVSGLTGQLDKMTGGAVTGFRNLSGGITNGVRGLQSFKVALAATGIGVILLAIGSLVSFFTSTKRGAEQLKVATQALGAAFDVIRDRISKVGGALVKFFTGDFKGALDDVKGAFTGITDEIIRETKAAGDLQKAMNALKDEERDFIKQRAETNKQIAEARLLAEDDTLAVEERIEALQRAVDLEQETVARQIELAEERARIAREQVALGESMEEDLQAVAEAEAAVIDLQTASLRTQKRLQTELNSLKVEGITKAHEAMQAEIDLANATDKAMEDRKKAEQGTLQVTQETAEATLQTRTTSFADQVLGSETTEEAIRRQRRETFEDFLNGAELVGIKGVEMASAALGALSQLNEAFAGESESDQKKAFERNKKFQVAQAIIQTGMAVTGALTAGGNPIKLATGAQFVEAAIAAATGVAQIATIKKTKFGSGSTPPPPGNRGAGGTASIPPTPQLDLGFLGAGAGQTGFRSYVIASEVSNSQQANQRINDQASLVG